MHALTSLFDVFLATIRDVVPIAAIIFGFQLFVLRRPVANLGKVLLGFFYVLLGLTFFLRAVPEHGLGVQFWFQLKGVLLSIIYTAVVTYVLILVVAKTVGFSSTKDEERAGMDHSLHGEQGYGLLNLN